MGKISFVSSTLAVTVIAGIGACAGTMDTQGGEPEIVGQRAELVFKKREWLQNYDENCDVCFQAFELCQRGAEDEATSDACQVALDSCVRGGLVNDDGEDGEVDIEDDAGVDDEQDDDDGVDVDVVGDEDEATDDDGVDVDVVGDDEEDGETDADNDTDADESVDESTDDEDGDLNGEPGDQTKGELIEDVRVCLDQGNACLEGGGDFRDCVQALKACVREALDGAFDSVCTDQLRLCRADGSAEELVSSVERLCEGGFEGGFDGRDGNN